MKGISSPTVPQNCQQCPHFSHSLLGTCQFSELALVAESKVYQVYRKGQLIFHSGSRTAGLYCVFEGKVKVSRFTADGKEQILRLAREGDAVGYHSLMSGEVCATTVTALTDCVVCLIPRPDFFSLLEQNAQFSHALLRLLARSLSRTEERLLHMAYKPVRERLAEALLLLQQLFQPQGEGPFSIPVCRDDLAALTGTTKETASRLLSDFRAEKLVTTQGSRITIRNLKKLAQLASLYD